MRRWDWPGSSPPYLQLCLPPLHALHLPRHPRRLRLQPRHHLPRLLVARALLRQLAAVALRLHSDAGALLLLLPQRALEGLQAGRRGGTQ
jgi:hypothetical protein